MRWLIVLLLSVSLTPPAHADALNLLLNGDFTAGKAHWNLPTGAALDPTGDSGRPALQVSNTKAAYTYATQSVPLDRAQVSVVHLAARMRWSNVVLGKNPWEGAVIILLFYDSAGKQVGGYPQIPALSGTGDWRLVEDDFTVPDGAVRMMALLGLQNCSGTVWFADVRVAAVTPPSGLPAVLYGTAFFTRSTPGSLFKVDTIKGTVTTVLKTPTSPDCLTFDPSGRIIYGIFGAGAGDGQVRLFDPADKTDRLIAGGFNGAADFLLEPGGKSVLMAEFWGGKIDRIDLATGAVRVLVDPGGNPNGLAYDDRGRLFVNLGTRDSRPLAWVAQLDPVTGATLRTSPKFSSLDGLTFDPLSRRLYATSFLGNAVYTVDPDNLNDVSPLPVTVVTPDGITADGAGNLFISGRAAGRVFVYNIPAKAITWSIVCPNIDDLAPASGPGAPP